MLRAIDKNNCDCIVLLFIHRKVESTKASGPRAVRADDPAPPGPGGATAGTGNRDAPDKKAFQKPKGQLSPQGEESHCAPRASRARDKGWDSPGQRLGQPEVSAAIQVWVSEHRAVMNRKSPSQKPDGSQYRCKASLIPGPSRKTRLSTPEVGKIIGLFRHVKKEFPPCGA